MDNNQNISGQQPPLQSEQQTQPEQQVQSQQTPFQQEEPDRFQQDSFQPTASQGAENAALGEESSELSQGKKRAVHAKAASSAFMQRSAKMRKLYVVIIILLCIVVAAIVVLAVRMVWTSDNSVTQQTQVVSTDLTEAGEGDDSSGNEVQKTTVPNLVELLGQKRAKAIEMIGHGAEIVSSRKVKEKGSDIARELTVELTDEPSDNNSGAPSVYLSLNKDGKVVHVGYSAAISSLGYGSASFADTVESEHIVENTLGEAGLSVEEGSAVLPEDETEYKSYSSDGSATTKEYCSFSGKGTANENTYDWEAILSYDYTVANASENLNDTIRIIFIYVS